VEINSDTDSAEVYAYPKFSSETLPGGSGTEYQVFKSWAGDEDYPDARPESVSIDIYFNDEFYATAELNEDNDWTYSWTAEEDGEWLAVESDVPDGYTVTYQTSENQLAVVNTYTPPEEETPPADSTPDESTPDEESVPDEDSTPDDESIPDEDSSSPDSSTPDSTVDSVPNDSSSQTPTGGTVTGGSGGSDGGSLPQTGQLWWPVPILAGAGLILVVLGTRFKVKKESENEI
jgi:hypothetical protein